jgi:hypothetical protein
MGAAERWVKDIRAYASRRKVRVPAISVNWGCPVLDEHHQHTPRVMAHAFHVKNGICLHQEAATLPTAYLAGILVHEVGHIASGDREQLSAEPRADQWVRDHLGLEVCYDMKAGGLEYLTHSDLRRLRLRRRA